MTSRMTGEAEFGRVRGRAGRGGGERGGGRGRGRGHGEHGEHGGHGGGWSGDRGDHRGGAAHRGGSEHQGVVYRGRGRGGHHNVSNMMAHLTLDEEPAPLPFSPPRNGEQEGYKAAAKPAPALRQGKKEIKVVTNEWELEYEDRLVYRYDVSVGLESIGNDGAAKLFSLNKGPRDDASVHERSELIREALRAGLEMYRILSTRGCIAHDGSAMMYANESFDDALKRYGHKLTIGVNYLPPGVRKLIRNAGVKNVVIEVAVDSKRFRIKDLSGMTNLDRSDMDQSVKQFFEVITSEHALNTNNYHFFSGGKLYRADPETELKGGNKYAWDIGSGQERRPGISKGFTLAEKNGQLIGALNIDVTTGTFWREEKLHETICELNGWRRPLDAKWDVYSIKKTNEMIKNLRLSYTPPDGKGSFDLIAYSLTADFSSAPNDWTDPNGFSSRSSTVSIRTMDQLTMKNDNGETVPLINKFNNCNLRLKNWPLIESRRVRKSAEDPSGFVTTVDYYPVELLGVKANQRVPLKKQGAEPERAMPVEDRWKETNKALEALNLFGRGPRAPINPVMEAFGIRVSRTPLTTTGITRRMPGVKFNRDADVDEKTSFRTGQLSYTKPAHITKLYFIASANPARYHFRGESFVKALLDAAGRKGMRIDNHHMEIVTPDKLFHALKKIREEKDKNDDPKLKKPVFLYIEPEESKSHDALKLFERKHLIVTQHLTMEIAEKMITNKPTMENVLLKLNVKGGGHNYNVQPEKFATGLWMNGKTLIMGYDVWHPTGQSHADKIADRMPEPSVVGFSFNGGVAPDSFCGDYHFQSGERVEDKILNARIKWMLKSFEKSRGILPPLIIVVRDGISDGQYKHGMDELSALREGAREYAVSPDRTKALNKPPVPDFEPKFIFVVATKRHHKRMYVEQRNEHRNMPAMSVVDDTITNPTLFEFFLQSHTPLQGTAKATKYTVLKDDIGTTSDAMQSLMGALCFEHQISTNAISIPEPVYQSDEWAKRGAANMRKFREIFGEKGKFKKEVTYQFLTDKLSYWGTELEQTRVNA